MKFTLLFVGLLSCFDISISTRKAAKFVSDTVRLRPDILGYKKIGTSSYFGLFGQNSKTQCSQACLNEDTCESFYMDGGECVFGVSGESAAFVEGQVVFPVDEQRIQAKGMS